MEDKEYEAKEHEQKDLAALNSSLTALEYDVIVNRGTERPFTGEYNQEWREGVFVCRRCSVPLFASNTKFEAGCGWPSFYDPITPDAVVYIEDNSLGRKRTEVRCASCDGHLGHVFADAPQQPTGQRYCTNSVSLRFVPTAADAAVTDTDMTEKERS